MKKFSAMRILLTFVIGLLVVPIPLFLLTIYDKQAHGRDPAVQQMAVLYMGVVAALLIGLRNEIGKPV